MSNFLKAAASYYGLGETAARKLELFTDGRDLVLAIEVRVADDDMAGILARMDNMQQLEKARQQPQAAPVMPGEQRMRDEYTAMDRMTKSQFGSFSVYRAWRLGQVMDEHMAGKVELPPYVYLSPAECTPQQKAMAVGQDEKGNYAVAVEDLTPEQHFERFATQDEKALAEADNTAAAIAARIAGGAEAAVLTGAGGKPANQAAARAAYDRLNGADGKPTSNADDFGGLPG